MQASLTQSPQNSQALATISYAISSASHLRGRPSSLSAPWSTPAGGSPDNNFSARPMKDADEESLDGLVNRNTYENDPWDHENGVYDIRQERVEIRLSTGGPVQRFEGAAAARFRHSVGGSWRDDMAVTVRFWGRNVIGVTRRALRPDEKR